MAGDNENGGPARSEDRARRDLQEVRVDSTTSGGQQSLKGPAREQFERTAARLAGEVWGGRWIPVPADELVDINEDELEHSA